MRFLYILFISTIFIIAMQACEEKSQEKSLEQVNETSQSIYGKTTIKTPVLNETVKEFTNRWGGYQDYEDDISKINRNTIEGLKIVTNRLVSQVDSLQNNIPDTLGTKSIVSRLIVVQTRARLLHQLVQRTQTDSVAIEESIQALTLANAQWVYQMNEKFAKDAIESVQKETEKKELEALKQKQDAILQAEIKDNQ